MEHLVNWLASHYPFLGKGQNVCKLSDVDMVRTFVLCSKIWIGFSLLMHCTSFFFSDHHKKLIIKNKVIVLLVCPLPPVVLFWVICLIHPIAAIVVTGIGIIFNGVGGFVTSFEDDAPPTVNFLSKSIIDGLLEVQKPYEKRQEYLEKYNELVSFKIN